MIKFFLQYLHRYHVTSVPIAMFYVWLGEGEGQGQGEGERRGRGTGRGRGGAGERESGRAGERESGRAGEGARFQIPIQEFCYIAYCRIITSKLITLSAFQNHNKDLLQKTQN